MDLAFKHKHPLISNQKIKKMRKLMKWNTNGVYSSFEKNMIRWE